MRLLTIIAFTVLVLGCTGTPEKQVAEVKDQINANATDAIKMKRVTGIGGIFFKSKDPEKMREWYHKNLGLKTNEFGSLFEFRSTDEPKSKGYLQWSPFSEKTKYFEPSPKEFMINYRVENLEKLLEELAQAGVEIVGEMESYEYEKFGHIMDPEGNKIELWEPVDSVFTKLYEGTKTH